MQLNRHILAAFLVLSTAIPALAIESIEPGPQTQIGYVIRAEGVLALLINPGFGESFMRLQGENADIQARLEQLAVPQRDFGDAYGGVTPVTLEGSVDAKTWLYVISEITAGDTVSAARGIQGMLPGALQDMESLLGRFAATDFESISREEHEAAFRILEGVDATLETLTGYATDPAQKEKLSGIKRRLRAEMQRLELF